jgi:DNA-binding transcriptional regulator YdaS (Cro superfamily)
MKLEQYRVKNNLTFGKLADLLGFSDHSNPARLVQRWCQGYIPSSTNIKKIVSATNGQVKAADFFQE